MRDNQFYFFPFLKACGLVKNLALMTHITVDVDEMPIARIAVSLGVEDIENLSRDDTTDFYTVFLNGKFLTWISYMSCVNANGQSYSQ